MHDVIRSRECTMRLDARLHQGQLFLLFYFIFVVFAGLGVHNPLLSETFHTRASVVARA